MKKRTRSTAEATKPEVIATPERKRDLAANVGRLGAAALLLAPGASAATFTVSNTNDGGAGSLRDAVDQANALAGPDVIDFAPTVSGTITLTSGRIDVTDDLEIQGPGPASLAVSGNNSSQVFYTAGLYNAGTSYPIDVLISGLTIRDGLAAGYGGGIEAYITNLELNDVVLAGNEAYVGGAVAAFDPGSVSSLTIVDSRVTGNTADGGGGVYTLYTGARIERTQFDANIASGFSGGGLYLLGGYDQLEILDSTISGNEAYTGGGLIVINSYAGTLIEGSTIEGNRALFGGGLDVVFSDDVTIRNSTISGNESVGGGPLEGGGGVLVYYAYADLDFVTIAGNSAATKGGGVEGYTAFLEISNSVIGDNVAPSNPDINGTAGFFGPSVFNVSTSLIEDPGATTINDNGGNVFNQDPQLGPLADNGGPTETHLPAPTSPVIDAANPASPVTVDQRDFPRTLTAPDMGAVELNGGQIEFQSAIYSVAEDGGVVTLTIVRSGGTDAASVDYQTIDGTANAGSDYTAGSGTVNFAAGQTIATVDIPILNDVIFEGDEQFTVSLSNPSAAAAIGTIDTTTVTISDDTSGGAEFSVASYVVNESDGVVVVTVVRTGGLEGTITVNYQTVAGSATAGDDFTPVSGTLVFPAGDGSPQTFSVPIIDDSTPEPQELFTVILTGDTAALDEATVAIVSNDPVPIPTLGFFAKLIAMFGTALAGIWAMRNRFPLLLLAALLLPAFAGPQLGAAESADGRRATVAERSRIFSGVHGTIVSLSETEDGIQIELDGGQTFSLTKKTKVFDRRGDRKGKGRVKLDVLEEGMQILVFERRRNVRVVIRDHAGES